MSIILYLKERVQTFQALKQDFRDDIAHFEITVATPIEPLVERQRDELGIVGMDERCVAKKLKAKRGVRQREKKG